ncbi:MAG: VOC family protein [Pseudomonadota bacterium]
MTVTRNPAPIRALGEIAIRCGDHAAMRAFYADIVGLPLLADDTDSQITFFRIAEGYGRHTTILALFDARAVQRDVHDQGTEPPKAGTTSTLHHLALTLDYGRQDDLCRFLDDKGVPFSVQHFDGIGWRGIFIKDPEGNTVEFVAGGHPRS